MSTAAKTVAGQTFSGFTRSLLSAFQFSLALTLKPQRIDKDKLQVGYLSLLPGIVVGLGYVATHVGLTWMWERPGPVWPGLVDANAAWPPVAVLPLNVTLRFMHELPLSLLAVTAATLLFPRSGDVDVPPPAIGKLAMYFIPSRLIVAAPTMLATVTWNALAPWAISQAITGMVTAAAFRVVYRHDLSQLPVGYSLGAICTPPVR
jgi:hypothetical protein